MKFLLPTGIGDSVWALTKIEAVRDKIHPGGPIDVALVGGDNEIDSRALDFVRRFKFVSSVCMKSFEIHGDNCRYKPSGCYNYIEDGLYEFDGERYCVLIPNAPLERGIRLEEWLPQYPIRWNIFDDFRIEPKEWLAGVKLKSYLGDYAVFYPGPLNGNTENGHNRNALWKPEDWVALARQIEALGLKIIVVGAPYDRSYYDLLLRPKVNGNVPWFDLIGTTNIGELFAVTSHAKFVISYQAGVGIVSTLLGTPTGIFWRPEGDSISPNVYLSFDERMASAWVPPRMIANGAHLPLIYGRHGVDYIVSEISSRGWV